MTRYNSPPGAEYQFEIDAEAPEEGKRRLTVKGMDATGARERTARYEIGAIDQNAYLDIFGALARDFGTRVPHNRRPPPPFAGRLACHPILTEHLSQDILYGYGDPAVLRVEDPGGPTFYLVATPNDAPRGIPLLHSRDLHGWSVVDFLLPEGDRPGWIAEGAHVSDLWAPELHRIGDRYLLCFTAREHDGSLSIGVAVGDAPAGPFSFPDRPLLRGGVIDSHILVAEEGPLLFWKEDRNGVWPRLLAGLLRDSITLVETLFDASEDRRTAVFTATLWPCIDALPQMEQFFLLQPLIEAVTSDFATMRDRLERLSMQDRAEADRVAAILSAMRTPVYAQPMAADGSALTGTPTEVLVNDLQWEGHLIEGVWVTRQRGRYWMFYAGNDFSTADYGIGVAVADTPLGPYRKSPRPLLCSAADWWGPGHPSVAVGPNGVPHLFLHAFFPGRTGYKAFRAVLSVPFDFRDEEVVLLPLEGSGGSL